MGERGGGEGSEVGGVEDRVISVRMAAHESPRTTRLYDRTNDQMSLDEVEWIVF